MRLAFFYQMALFLSLGLLYPVWGQEDQAPTTTETNSTNDPGTPPAIPLNVSPGSTLLKKAICPQGEGYTVNFQDISIIQLIQFVSKISGTNFVFDTNDLQFNITIVSEDPTSVQDLSAALLQTLRMHNLSVAEMGNNVVIYKNQNISRLATVITDENVNDSCNTALVTRVFRLYSVDPTKMQSIVKPLLSPDAIVEVSVETHHLIVSDITSNVDKIADLLIAIDTPNASLEIVEYQVKSAHPEALVSYVKEILVPISRDNPIRIIAQPGTNKIFILSTPSLNAKALRILQSLDKPEIVDVPGIVDTSTSPSNALSNNNLKMYKLKYHDGSEIAAALREIGNNLQSTGVASTDFINTIYSIQWIEVNNSIVITGSESTVQKVVQLLDDLDQPPKQVYIEVLIIDTSLANSLDFGVQWIALGDEQNKLAYASGLLSNTPPAPALQGGTRSSPGARYIASNPASGPPSVPNPGRDVALPEPSQLSGIADLANQTAAFGLGIVGNIVRHNGQSFLTLGALVSALDEEAETKIVLNPRIMVEETQAATFFVGLNIPYQTTSTVIQQTGSVTQNIQYEDIGVQLQVTPTIAPNRVVTLQINQTISDVTSATTQNLTPTTTKVLATTRVHVPDNCFLVMSGHIRDLSSNIQSGIPCLGTLPLIGPMFSRTIEQRQKRNLILFIRPRVIDSFEEGVELTNQEGYEYNFESHPDALNECGSERAPECEVYVPYDVPPQPLLPSLQSDLIQK